jgi:hypothetical protein
MDGSTTPDIKRAGRALVALAATIGCGGSLPDKGGAGGVGGNGWWPDACCPDQNVSISRLVRARGFEAYDGMPVKAAFVFSGFIGSVMAETSVSGGAFDLDFPPYDGQCYDPAYYNGAGAIYIDTDGDGVCNPAVDYLFAWSALGAGGTTCSTLDLTPQSPNCPGAKGIVDFKYLEATSLVCPATNGCYACPGPSPDAGAVVTCLI